MSGAEDRRDRVEVRVAEDPDDRQFVPRWRELQAEAGKAGAAIAVRPEGLLEERVANGEAVLAFLDGEFVGAGYLMTIGEIPMVGLDYAFHVGDGYQLHVLVAQLYLRW